MNDKTKTIDHETAEETTSAKELSIYDRFTPDSRKVAKLAASEAKTIEALISADPDSPFYSDALTAIHSIGRDEVSSSSAELDKLLSSSLIVDAGETTASKTADSNLTSLRDTIVKYAPAGSPASTSGKFFSALSKLPGGSWLNNQKSKRESANKKIQDISRELDASQKLLGDDIMVVTSERKRLWRNLEVLAEQDALFGALEERVEAEADRLEAAGDVRRAKSLRTEALKAVMLRRRGILEHALTVFSANATLESIHATAVDQRTSLLDSQHNTIAALRMSIGSRQIIEHQKRIARQRDELEQVAGDLILKNAQDSAALQRDIREQTLKGSINSDKILEAWSIAEQSVREAEAANERAVDQLRASRRELVAAIQKGKETAA